MGLFRDNGKENGNYYSGLYGVTDEDHMSESLNSLKGGETSDYLGEYV